MSEKSMTFEYEATFRIDLGKAIPSVGELLKSVNDHLATMGVEERITLQSEVFSFLVQVNRILTEEEEHKMKRIIEAQVITSMPRQDVRLSSFVRKSGNVSQSVTL